MATGVLKVKVGGTWQPVMGGAEEVFVGPNDPGDPYEIWYDTDEPVGLPNLTTGPATSVTDNVISFGNTTGNVLKDSGIPAGQIARKDQGNIFTQNQVLLAPYPSLVLDDTVPPANSRKFVIANSTQVLQFYSVDDAYGSSVVGLTVNRSGDVSIGRDIYEKGRTTALDHPIPFTMAAQAPTAISAQTAAAYSLSGKRLTLSIYIQDTFTTSTINTLYYLLPGGFVCAYHSTGPVLVNIGGPWEVAVALISSNSSVINIHRNGLAAFPAMTTLSIHFSLSCLVQ